VRAGPSSRPPTGRGARRPPFHLEAAAVDDESDSLVLRTAPIARFPVGICFAAWAMARHPVRNRAVCAPTSASLRSATPLAVPARNASGPCGSHDPWPHGGGRRRPSRSATGAVDLLTAASRRLLPCPTPGAGSGQLLRRFARKPLRRTGHRRRANARSLSRNAVYRRLWALHSAVIAVFEAPADAALLRGCRTTSD